MRMHCLRHVDFEDEAGIGAWAKARGHEVTHSNLHAGDALPAPDAFDWLVVMGGSMGVHDVAACPWILPEKLLISQAVELEKTVLGICLGAQLIADVLGAPVTRNEFKEIGWYPVRLTANAAQSPVFAHLPPEFMAFHWHGDTFACPTGSLHAAYSVGCANQAFVFNTRVVGLQFHLETSSDSMERLMANCPEDIAAGPYVQSAETMRKMGNENLDTLHPLMEILLNGLASVSGV